MCGSDLYGSDVTYLNFKYIDCLDPIAENFLLWVESGLIDCADLSERSKTGVS